MPTTTDSAPHRFRPLTFLDRLRARGRCRACLMPKGTHPTERWEASRALGDRGPSMRQSLLGSWYR